MLGAGRVSESVGRALEPAGRIMEPAGRVLESAGRVHSVILVHILMYIFLTDLSQGRRTSVHRKHKICVPHNISISAQRLFRDNLVSFSPIFTSASSFNPTNEIFSVSQIEKNKILIRELFDGDEFG